MTQLAADQLVGGWEGYGERRCNNDKDDTDGHPRRRQH